MILGRSRLRSLPLAVSLTALMILSLSGVRAFAETRDCKARLDELTEVLKVTPEGLRPLKEDGRVVRVPVINAGQGEADLDSFMGGKALVPGGVVHTPVGNQKYAEICWAYSIKELADALHLRDTGEFVESSADHSGFWHIYAQIFQHKSYFTRLAQRVRQGELTMDAATTQAVRLLHSRPGSASAKAAGFVVQPGSDEPTALSEAAVFGMVPDALYDHPISNMTQNKNLGLTLKNMVKSVLSSPDLGSMFNSTDPDGVNTPLYNLIVHELASFLGGGASHPPYRPGDKFTYKGQTFTPPQFMTQVLNFDPASFAMIVAADENQNLIYEAVRDSLTAPKPVPVIMGFVVLNQQQAEKAGVWSQDIFVGQQPELAGGHDVLIVNAKVDEKGQTVGHIFQNSWGAQGLNADGEKPASADKAGFNGVTTGYDSFVLSIKEGSDYVFSRELLNSPKYSNLHPSDSRQEGLHTAKE